MAEHTKQEKDVLGTHTRNDILKPKVDKNSLRTHHITKPFSFQMEKMTQQHISPKNLKECQASMKTRFNIFSH